MESIFKFISELFAGFFGLLFFQLALIAIGILGLLVNHYFF
jgi:mannose/fructose/N-acetylgalactosamine-specific phosphotransferase system component IIC